MSLPYGRDRWTLNPNNELTVARHGAKESSMDDVSSNITETIVISFQFLFDKKPTYKLKI